MIAQLHRQQLVHGFLRHVGVPWLLPRAVVIEDPEHLISVSQFLGHDPEDGHLHLVGRRFLQGQAVLLDGTEFGGCLRAHDVARRVKHIADHVAGVLEARLSHHPAEADVLGAEFADFGEELEGSLAGVVAGPVLEQEIEFRKVLFLPRHHGIVVFRRDGLGCVGCQKDPPEDAGLCNARGEPNILGIGAIMRPARAAGIVSG